MSKITLSTGLCLGLRSLQATLEKAMRVEKVTIFHTDISAKPIDGDSENDNSRIITFEKLVAISACGSLMFSQAGVAAVLIKKIKRNNSDDYWETMCVVLGLVPVNMYGEKWEGEDPERIKMGSLYCCEEPTSEQIKNWSESDHHFAGLIPQMDTRPQLSFFAPRGSDSTHGVGIKVLG